MARVGSSDAEPYVSMNILITSYQSGMAGSIYSISFLAKGLADKGHKVVVAGSLDSLLFQLLRDSAVQLIGLPFSSKFDRRTLLALRHIIVSQDIQIVNAQSSRDRYLTIFAKWYHRLDVKLIHTRRQRPLSIGGWLHNKFYVKGTDKIVVISDELQQIFIRHGFPVDHLHVIYNGTPREQYQVDETLVRDLRKKLGIQLEDVVVGCVARRKRQDQLIAALPYLEPSVKVLFVGIEPGSLDELVAKHQVKNEIIYAGQLDHATTLASYQLMDVNVLPSDMDGFGLVLVEAMAMSTPVIGTDFGGIRNVVKDGINGLLYENENPQELAKKIRLLLEDKSLRSQLINEGLNTAYNEYSIEKTVDNYESFFQQLISSS